MGLMKFTKWFYSAFFCLFRWAKPAQGWLNNVSGVGAGAWGRRSPKFFQKSLDMLR